MNNVFFAVTTIAVATYYLILRLKIFKLENRIEDMEIFIEALKHCITKQEEDKNGNQE